MKGKKKKRVSFFDKKIKKFRIGVEENEMVKTCDGKKRPVEECPTIEDKPLK